MLRGPPPRLCTYRRLARIRGSLGAGEESVFSLASLRYLSVCWLRPSPRHFGRCIPTSRSLSSTDRPKTLATDAASCSRRPMSTDVPSWCSAWTFGKPSTGFGRSPLQYVSLGEGHRTPSQQLGFARTQTRTSRPSSAERTRTETWRIRLCTAGANREALARRLCGMSSWLRFSTHCSTGGGQTPALPWAPETSPFPLSTPTRTICICSQQHQRQPLGNWQISNQRSPALGSSLAPTPCSFWPMRTLFCLSSVVSRFRARSSCELQSYRCLAWASTGVGRRTRRRPTGPMGPRAVGRSTATCFATGSSQTP